MNRHYLLKALAALLVLMMTFSFLVSCGGNDSDNEDPEHIIPENGQPDGSEPEEKPGDAPGDDNKEDDSKEDDNKEDSNDNVNTVDPNSPEGKAQAELNTVIAYLDNHFKTNDVWDPKDNRIYGLIKLPNGKYQCTLAGEPTKLLNLSAILETFKDVFELDGTFTYEGDDVIYTLADGTGSARWADIDAFDLDAYMQSDEYKEIIKQATITSLKQEISQLNKMLLADIIMDNRVEVTSEIYLYQESSALKVNQGNLADALNLWITTGDVGSASGTFSMNGDDVVYTSIELPEASVVWSWDF